MEVLTGQPTRARATLTGLVGQPSRGRGVAPARLTGAILGPVRHRPPPKAPAITKARQDLTIPAPGVPGVARIATAKSP